MFFVVQTVRSFLLYAAPLNINSPVFWTGLLHWWGRCFLRIVLDEGSEVDGLPLSRLPTYHTANSHTDASVHQQSPTRQCKLAPFSAIFKTNRWRYFPLLLIHPYYSGKILFMDHYKGACEVTFHVCMICFLSLSGSERGVTSSCRSTRLFQSRHMFPSPRWDRKHLHKRHRAVAFCCHQLVAVLENHAHRHKESLTGTGEFGISHRWHQRWLSSWVYMNIFLMWIPRRPHTWLIFL